MTKTFLTIAFIFSFSILFAQNSTGYWQQHVDYEMEIDFDAKNYQYDGSQVLEYTNNSPDTLKRVFYHMYFNAFQPGSEMDVRSRTIEDPDSRVGDRISKLSDEEIGFMRAKTLRQDGKKLNFKLVGTVLEVELNKPILPKESSTFKMDFEGQVPVQIRRSGRNNAEGVELSMTQWYPKMAEYDFEGWHADPYIAREFHGVWGNFDVKITIDKGFILGGSGYVQNPNEVGYGYEDDGEKVRRRGKKLTWHFNAPNVHDFTWAADKDYIHDKITRSDGTTLHFLYKNNEEIIENWKNLQSKTSDILDFFNEHIGPYPYDQYSVIQGGDGGMEYAMCTLITGEREFGSLVGVTAHEMAHSWFQHILATDEAQHEWMDEGFTSYISALAMNEVMDQNKDNVFARTYKGYTNLANSGLEQPQTTHADRYEYNRAYGVTAYSKGAVFLAQLGYLIGQENLDNTLNRYFDEWKFKHPTPNDFIRIAEKASGAELSWYLNDWTRTTNTIDYAVKGVSIGSETTLVTLERVALTPMPIEVKVDFKGGTSETYYIPLRIMRWTKPDATNIQENWAWAYPTYTLEIPTAQYEIEKIEIDPSGLMADVNRENNLMILGE
jgi:hypothetical protein